jgi:rod shape determining protein RodA
MDPQRLHIDKPLLYALFLLAVLSLIVVYSATGKDLSATGAQVLRLLIGFAALFAVAQVRPENLERWSPWVFGAALVLTLAVLGLGVIGKGAQRWLHLGPLRFQPSELMKLALPMMLAWLFAREGIPPRLWRLLLALAITLVPVAIIARQPDLGTAVLVFAAGAIMVFLAGMSWRLILPLLGLLAAAAPFAWHFLHDYQRHRVLTLLDPASDPLGRGYHTIQSMIAVGSGGFYGKGWLNGTQAHLDFLPERSTDFIFAVFGEEFGLIGNAALLILYLLLIARALVITANASTLFARLIAGAITLMLFTYAFVNMGMVSGVLPIVGVPLPMMSYGGTALVSLFAGLGILMSVQAHRKLVAT